MCTKSRVKQFRHETDLSSARFLNVRRRRTRALLSARSVRRETVFVRNRSKPLGFSGISFFSSSRTLRNTSVSPSALRPDNSVITTTVVFFPPTTSIMFILVYVPVVRVCSYAFFHRPRRDLAPKPYPVYVHLLSYTYRAYCVAAKK